MRFFVSRQSYWPDGDKVVEIAEGGLDYANPDMLVEKWPELGEGAEFTDPRKAAQAALAIAKAWQAAEPDEEINVAYGNTMGFTCPFEPTSAKELLAWAEAKWQRLPKCDHCGEPLEEGEQWFIPGADDLRYCSERCADEAWAEMMEELQDVEA